MDFTAIDFETANRRADSACQLGAVVVRGGEITQRHQWLIRPRPFYFDAGNIRIHGIRPEQVADEPEFDELWDEIWSVLAGECLVAHNAAFDIRVLRECLATHEIPLPDFDFTCTRLIARQAWPHWQGFGLGVIARRLQITFRHHDALEDAMACARVLLAAASQANVGSLTELDQRYALQRGRCHTADYQAAGSLYTSTSPRPTSRRRSRYSGYSRTGYAASRSGSASATVSLRAMRVAENDATVTGGLDLHRLQRKAETLRLWVGKRVVFTGVLRRMQRHQAELLAECLGARCQRSVSGKTDLVVIGQPDQRTIAAGRTQSVKEEQARCRARDGQPIEFLTEEAFLRLLEID